MKSEYLWPIVGVGVAVLLRWITGLSSYSGMHTPPMYGDYEAQRHWMEITYNLPIREWYVHGVDNNLSYWGLDYPPLTAYHSYAMGIVRGVESYAHKYFMRLSVLFADMCTMLPALAVYVFVVQVRAHKSLSAKSVFMAVQLAYPGLMLMDNAHFQYNCVSLGMYTLCVLAIMLNHNVFACVCFVAAVNYKQMELYHALPLFVWMLASALRAPGRSWCARIRTLVVISAVTAVTFAIIWYPFIRLGSTDVLHVLHRIFPLKRGVFEDKVGNFWGASNVVIKWKSLFDQDTMVKICAVTTLLLSVPSLWMLFWHHSKRQFLQSSLVVSMAFYLFSYQVHEKSILLVAVPAILLLHHDIFPCVWLLNITTISLHPLCTKDHTQLAFYSLTITYYVVTTDVFVISARPATTSARTAGVPAPHRDYMATLYHISIIAALLLCVGADLFTPPRRYPDLWPVLNALFSFSHFFLAFVYFYAQQFKLIWHERVMNSKKKVK